MIANLQIRINSEIKKRLRKLAIDREKSMQDLIVELVVEHLKQNEQKQGGK